MKEEFQSKDIQKILEIQKQRVEYLALKVPIKPEIEEVDRSGMVHKYSFKNVLQFAIAHTINKYGLGISEVRRVLNTLDIKGTDNTRLMCKKGEKWLKELKKAIREYYEPESDARLWCNITETRIRGSGKRVKALMFYNDLQYMGLGYITTVVNLVMIKERLVRDIENISL